MIFDGVEPVELLWHRRHAMQVAMQLPDNLPDALLVLQAAHRLVLSYLGDDVVRPVDERDDLPLVLPARELAVVIPFPAACSSAEVSR